MNKPDPHAGHGGSYRVDAAGNKTLVERTQEAPKASSAGVPTAASEPSGAKGKKHAVIPQAVPAAASAADSSTVEKE